MIGVQRIWVPDGDDYRCTLHGVRFDRLSTCHDCDRAAPSRPNEPGIFDPPTTPDGCMSSLALERKLIDLAGFVESKARSVMGAKVRSRIAYATGAKLVAEAAKLYRLCSELARAREDAELVDRREARIAARDRGVH